MSYLTLVNQTHRLASNYNPPYLVIDPLTQICVRGEVLSAIRRLNQRLEKEGLESLVIVSGYRPYAYQEKLYMRKVDRLMQEGMSLEAAKNAAGRVVAVPGSSEHQLGLAVDVTIQSMSALEDPLIEDFGETLVGKWLLANSYKEGLILRYPKEKIEITGITYEPWHYRYVGKIPALVMKALDLCLEEYLLMD